MVLYKSIAIGTGAWFAAAQYIKYTGVAEPSTRLSNLALFGQAFPVGISAILLPKVLGVPAKDCFEVISLATAAALILDGLATVMFPFLYTYQKSTPIEALAAIAFGGGWGIFASYIVTARRSYGF